MATDMDIDLDLDVYIYGRIKEYTLNHVRHPCILEGIVLNRAILGWGSL